LLPVLRQLRGWFLAGALLVCLALFAGLVHDFGQTEAAAGWFTSRPLLPALLLGIGFLLMLAHRLSSRGE
jgi:hypothetical protein